MDNDELDDIAWELGCPTKLFTERFRMTEINEIDDPEFNAILDKIKQLHNQKRYQYANETESMGNFIRAARLTGKLINPAIPTSLHPMVMALMYVSKQVDAVYDIIGEQKANTLESLNDKLQDVAVYFILAMILHERAEHEPVAK